jgi:hypothetical protein
MSAHDALCPLHKNTLTQHHSMCRCALIARVRADEQRLSQMEASDARREERAAVAEEIAQAIEEIAPIAAHPDLIYRSDARRAARRIGGTR